MRWIHIAAGLIGIASGFVALFAWKGHTLHRWSGRVFVASMLVMTVSAAVIAAFIRSNPGNVVAGLLTFYMVCTAFLAVRAHPPVLDRVALWFAAVLGVSAIAFGTLRGEELRALAAAGHGYPAGAFFVFGAVAMLFAWTDRRMLARGTLSGAARLKRHLGRMCGSLLIATGSLFMGQPQVFAGTLLEPAGLRFLPVLTIIVSMIYLRRRLTRSAAAGTRRRWGGGGLGTTHEVSAP